MARTRRIRAGWRTLGAALDELGWPWLRLRGELVAGRLFFRTHPEAHEHEIDWSDDTLRVDLAASTVCTWIEVDWSDDSLRKFALAATTVPTWEMGTVAVEVWLPVGQHPPATAPRGPWQKKPSRDGLKDAVEDAAEAYSSEDPPPFDEFWAAVKIRAPGTSQIQMRKALKELVPHLRRTRGQTRKNKSSA